MQYTEFGLVTNASPGASEPGLTVRTVGSVTTASISSSGNTVTANTASASNAQVVASNANRKHLSVFNNATLGGASIFIRFGSTAANTTNAFTVKIGPQDYWTPPINSTEAIQAIWDAADSSVANFTEFT